MAELCGPEECQMGNARRPYTLPKYAPAGDRGGINLWVRHRMNGTDFCDWQKAAKLKLGAQWAA